MRLFVCELVMLIPREALIKSGMQIAQTDFSSGGCRPQDCMKVTQEYLMYFKEFSCNKTENMQARCVPRFIQRFLKDTFGFRKVRYRGIAKNLNKLNILFACANLLTVKCAQKDFRPVKGQVCPF